MIEGYVEFVDFYIVSVNGELICVKYIVIVIGVYFSILNVFGVELGGFFDDVFVWEELLELVVILGVGYIVVELVGVFYIFGVKIDFFVCCDCFLCGFDFYIVEGLVKEMERINLLFYIYKVFVKLEKIVEGIIIYFEDGISYIVS